MYVWGLGFYWFFSPKKSGVFLLFWVGFDCWFGVVVFKAIQVEFTYFPIAELKGRAGHPLFWKMARLKRTGSTSSRTRRYGSSSPAPRLVVFQLAFLQEEIHI